MAVGLQESIDAAPEAEQFAMVGQLSAGCLPCMMAAGDDGMQTCFPDGDEGPPACVATCDWSAGCPADCDTSACSADGVPNKAEIDAYLAGGCDEGGGDDTCTTEDLVVLVSHPLTLRLLSKRCSPAAGASRGTRSV